jgi:hypothetical protein
MATGDIPHPFKTLLTKEQNMNINHGNEPGIRLALRQVAPSLPRQPDPIAGFCFCRSMDLDQTAKPGSTTFCVHGLVMTA